jgi:hypothetical protein
VQRFATKGAENLLASHTPSQAIAEVVKNVVPRIVDVRLATFIPSQLG